MWKTGFCRCLLLRVTLWTVSCGRVDKSQGRAEAFSYMNEHWFVLWAFYKIIRWLVRTKHFPGSKTIPRTQNNFQNPKHVPESKSTPQNAKTRPRIQKHFPDSDTRHKGAFLWDDPDQDQWSKITRNKVDQMNQWILIQSGFIGSFDLTWSEWSRITDPDPDHPKGTRP